MRTLARPGEEEQQRFEKMIAMGPKLDCMRDHAAVRFRIRIRGLTFLS
jgi:hypothetical protein